MLLAGMILKFVNLTENKIPESLLEKVAGVALEELGIKKKTEISLVLVGSGRMRALNKRYRAKNRVTDVLSFGGKAKKDIAFVEPPDNVLRLGEIVICLPVAKKQARRGNHSLEDEMTMLLVHGILHLAGYEHREDGEAEKMEDLEKRILTKLK